MTESTRTVLEVIQQDYTVIQKLNDIGVIMTQEFSKRMKYLSYHIQITQVNKMKPFLKRLK